MPFSETKPQKTAFQEAKTRFYMKKGLAQMLETLLKSWFQQMYLPVSVFRQA